MQTYTLCGRIAFEEIDREARRINEAKPSVDDDCALLGNTESVARAAGLSIMTDLELSTSAGEAGTLPPPSEPFAVQVVRSMNLAALAPAINPEQVAARNAAAIRRDTELINRFVADQIEIARR